MGNKYTIDCEHSHINETDSECEQQDGLGTKFLRSHKLTTKRLELLDGAKKDFRTAKVGSFVIFARSVIESLFLHCGVLFLALFDSFFSTVPQFTS